METTKHTASEEREFKLLVRRDPVSGGLSVAASSSGAWASSISLGVSDEGMPCCTAVISPAPDMQATAAAALQPDGEPEHIEDEALESAVIEQEAEEEPAAATAAAEPKSTEEKAPNQTDKPVKAEKPAEKLEGRPFEEIAKGAAKKASGAKPASGKQPSKPLSSSRQPSRTVTGGTQAAARR